MSNPSHPPPFHHINEGEKNKMSIRLNILLPFLTSFILDSNILLGSLSSTPLSALKIHIYSLR